jgi:hypothetical protein
MHNFAFRAQAAPDVRRQPAVSKTLQLPYPYTFSLKMKNAMSAETVYNFHHST